MLQWGRRALSTLFFRFPGEFSPPLRVLCMGCRGGLHWFTNIEQQNTERRELQTSNINRHFTLVAWKDDTLRHKRHRGIYEIGPRNRRDTSAGTTSCSSTQLKRKSQGEYKSYGLQVLA